METDCYSLFLLRVILIVLFPWHLTSESDNLVPVPSTSASIDSSLTEAKMSAEDQVPKIELLTWTDDEYGGVIVEMDKPVDSATFLSVLRASISHWKQLVVSLIWVLHCKQFLPADFIHWLDTY